jgi:hypothetical protein
LNGTHQLLAYQSRHLTVRQGDVESHWVTDTSMCDLANSYQVLNRRCQFTLLAPKVNIKSLWCWVLNQESRQRTPWSTRRYRVSLFRACLFTVINSCSCACYLFWARWPCNWTRQYIWGQAGTVVSGLWGSFQNAKGSP